jgi:hypothetical protein
MRCFGEIGVRVPGEREWDRYRKGRRERGQGKRARGKFTQKGEEGVPIPMGNNAR